MSKQYVLGVDHGSGGCKVTCLDSSGERVSESYVPYPSYYPQSRWVEQDPEQWIDAAVEGIRKTLSGFTLIQRREIKGIAFSAPHHVAVLLDKDRKVLRRVIMWNDQRSGDESKKLYEEYGELIFQITNHRPTPTWTLPQMLWLLKNEPHIYEKIDKIVFEKDYVRYRFSGELATDHIEAEGSMFYDVHKQEWSEPLLALISLDKSVLPKVYSPTDQCGTLTTEMANRLEIPAGIPIIVGTADTAAEVYGCGAVEAGDGVVKLATAGNFTLLSPTWHTNTNLTGYDFLIDGLHYQNSATNFAAASFRWLKESFYKEWENTLSDDQIYPAIDKEVANTIPGAEGMLFQPYLNGERSPHWDPYLRGSFFGVTARHHRGHFARAVLEGVAFSIRDAALEFPQRPSKPIKIIGGGGKGKVWSQIMADILNLELEVPKVSDASFGGCLIAATAVGWYSDLREAVSQAQSIVDRISPNVSNLSMYDEMFLIYQELHEQTKSLSHKLTNLQENLNKVAE